MYRFVPPSDQSAEQFKLSFAGSLTHENRWVQLAQLVPWAEFESEYAQSFSPTQGAPAKTFQVALGSLIIKERLGTSDAETVEQIRENPYLQYFLGFEEYSNTPPFEASMLVHFRKRLPLSLIGRVNERMVERAMAQSQPPCETATQSEQETPSAHPDSSVVGESGNSIEAETRQAQQPEVSNKGKLIIDASCAPADIHYPTDLGLLNSGREHTEAIMDELYAQVKDEVPQKPRTYRQTARRDFLNASRKRKRSGKQRRKAIKKQLNYVRRNLAHIDALLRAGASLTGLSRFHYQTLLVVSEVFRQQEWMYKTVTHRIDDRIVSIAQPHVRPIVRGKAGTPVEFGAKFSASCNEDGFVFLDHLRWDNLNESGDLQQQAEAYKARHDYYPEVIYADQIYRTRANRAWCAQRNIRLMGPPLGRPQKDQKAALRQQTREDEKIRNHIEGKFGQAKRRFSLARVMAKLASTAETTIAVTFLVMNLQRLLRQVFGVLFLSPWQIHRAHHALWGGHGVLFGGIISTSKPFSIAPRVPLETLLNSFLILGPL
ncbi:MAG: IS5 family transposase [Thermosynechococcaceae cyanobacterium]